MIKNSKRRACSGHLEIILAVIIAIIGVAWYLSSRSAKNQTSYYPPPQYAAVESPQIMPSDSSYPSKINNTLLFISGGLIYIIGVMSGLFFPLMHSMKHKHHKVPFSFSCLLPTKGNRAMGFLDDLQKMRDAGLISKHEYESKRLEFLAKL